MHDAAASADSFGESRLEFFASLGKVRDVSDWGGYACNPIRDVMAVVSVAAAWCFRKGK